MQIQLPQPVARPSAETLRAASTQAEQAARVCQLPFRQLVWRGMAGQWQGSGTGSSLDFQDHRAYVPGDDPRHINWQAYARTGNYTMKLYREEVSPSVDICLDASPSHWVHADKAARTLELVLFCIESARRNGASLRLWTVDGDKFAPVDPARAAIETCWIPESAPAERPVAPAWRRIPWRPGAMRVFISDLLFPGDPRAILPEGQWRGFVLCPWSAAEPELDGTGNCELEDCENGRLRRLHIDRRLRRTHEEAYRRHFTLWDAALVNAGVRFARIGSTGPLEENLNAEALRSGVVEPVK